MDEEIYSTYDEFQQTDFWLWFHIKEKTTQILANNDVLVSLEPGNWQSEIDLSITLNPKNLLIKGKLELTRDWISGLHDPANPFALDIGRNFIGALLPLPDRREIADHLGTVFQMSPAMKARRDIQDGYDSTVLNSENSPATMAYQALLTFMGASVSFQRVLDFSKISLTNVKYGEHEWLRIEVSILDIKRV